MAEVDLENEANQLQFIARGFTQAEADALAENMQKNFLAVATIGAGLDGMREDLEKTSTEIKTMRDELAALQAASPPTADEVTQQTQRTVLENQVAALLAHQGNLTTQLMNPELVLRTPESIQAEMDRTMARLSELQAQLATFPPVVDPLTQDQQDPELTLKNLELAQLEARWNSLFTGILEQEALARSGTVDIRQPDAGHLRGHRRGSDRAHRTGAWTGHDVVCQGPRRGTAGHRGDAVAAAGHRPPSDWRALVPRKPRR
jgi:chromosome segregation ATPase